MGGIVLITKTGTISKKVKSNYLPYLLLAPAVLLAFFVYIYPLFNALILSVSEFKLTTSRIPKFNGIKNFIDLFRDANFLLAMKNTFSWVVGSNILHFSLGLGFALLLNQKLIARPLWRGIFVLPWITPIIVAGIVWKWLLNVQWGILNDFLVNIGIIASPINWLGRGPFLIPTIIFINGWKAFGFMCLSFLAGLQSVPNELYEAAVVDGATGWQKFFRITFPLLKPVVVINLLLGIAWTFKDFNVVWVLTKGGPNYDSMVYGTYIYKQAFEFYNFGYASAIGVFGFIIIMIFAWIYLKKLDE